jgi:hypothetical protein
MEKEIRSQYQKNSDLTDAFIAFRIFCNEKARKIYDLNLNAKPNQFRSWPFILDYINDSQEIITKTDIPNLFSERRFLQEHLNKIVNRLFGFDFLINGLGKRSASGEMEEVGRASIAAMRVYFYFYYGIPILLGYFANQWFYLLLLPIVLIKFYLEYKRVKLEYYYINLH